LAIKEAEVNAIAALDQANAGKTNRDAEIKDLWTTWT
jgi:hypothetical protein